MGPCTANDLLRYHNCFGKHCASHRCIYSTDVNAVWYYKMVRPLMANVCNSDQEKCEFVHMKAKLLPHLVLKT